MEGKGIKTFMLIASLSTTLNATVMAQNGKEYKKIEMEKMSDTIHVSADSLWSIVRQFDDVAVWSSAMDKITLHGAPEFEGATCNSRTCESAQGFGTVQEKMILFNDASRELAYESTEGGPDFLLYGKNHWTIVELSPSASALKVDFEIHLKRFPSFFIGGFVKKAISKGLPQFFSDLKTYAETGEVSEAKKERRKKYERKYLVIQRSLISDTINVSAQALWNICREFDKTAEWTSTLNHSYGTGTPVHEGATCSSRTCETTIGKGNTVVEELVLFSDENMELSYNLTQGAPGFVTLANNHWKIIEISPQQSIIEMHVSMHLKRFPGFSLNRILTKQMEKQVGVVLSELKTYAETGEVSEAKQKQLKKQMKKKQKHLVTHKDN